MHSSTMRIARFNGHLCRRVVCVQRGCPGEECMCVWGGYQGVCPGWVCVCVPGGFTPLDREADTPPPPPREHNDRQTDVKTLPSRNFVCGR